MFFIYLSIEPRSQRGQEKEGRDAFAMCWINTNYQQDAQQIALACLDKRGWAPKEIKKIKLVCKEDYQHDPDLLSYFNKAERDGTFFHLYEWLNEATEESGLVIPNTVDGYRQRFRNAPVGRWNSSIEFGPWPTDVWEFYENGAGKIIQGLSSRDNVMLFEWQPEAEFTIKFRITDWGIPWDDEVPEENSDTNEDEPMSWCFIVYDFKTIEHYSSIVVMYQVPEAEVCKFWLTMGYLQFEGDVKK